MSGKQAPYNKILVIGQTHFASCASALVGYGLIPNRSSARRRPFLMICISSGAPGNAAPFWQSTLLKALVFESEKTTIRQSKVFITQLVRLRYKLELFFVAVFHIPALLFRAATASHTAGRRLQHFDKHALISGSPLVSP